MPTFYSSTLLHSLCNIVILKNISSSLEQFYFLRRYFSYLLLHNKSPQNFVATKNNQLWYFNVSVGQELKRSSAEKVYLGVFQEDRERSRCSRGGRHWCSQGLAGHLSLSPCITLRHSPCGPSGFIWASSQHGGLRIARLLTWMPRVSKQGSQLVSKKLSHPLWKPHRVGQSLPSFKGRGHRPHLLTGEILLEPPENTIWLKWLKQQQPRLLSINSGSTLSQVIEYLGAKKQINAIVAILNENWLLKEVTKFSDS